LALCLPYDAHNEQRLSPYILFRLTIHLCKAKRPCSLRSRNWIHIYIKCRMTSWTDT